MSSSSSRTQSKRRVNKNTNKSHNKGPSPWKNEELYKVEHEMRNEDFVKESNSKIPQRKVQHDEQDSNLGERNVEIKTKTNDNEGEERSIKAGEHLILNNIETPEGAFWIFKY